MEKGGFTLGMRFWGKKEATRWEKRLEMDEKSANVEKDLSNPGGVWCSVVAASCPLLKPGILDGRDDWPLTYVISHGIWPLAPRLLYLCDLCGRQRCIAAL